MPVTKSPKLYNWSHTPAEPFIMHLTHAGVNYSFNMPLVADYYFRATFVKGRAMDYILDYKYSNGIVPWPLFGEVANQFFLAMQEYLEAQRKVTETTAEGEGESQ